MKSLVSLSLLLLLPTMASAQEGAIDIGLAAGGLFPDRLEVIGNAPAISPRIGYWFSETMLLEADLGFSVGNTQIGTPDPFNYFTATPRVNIVGRIWADKPLNVLFVAGFGAWAKKINDNGELVLPQGEGVDLDFLGNAGPGLMVPLGDSMALRTDLRWMLSLGSENWQNHGDAFMSWEWTAGVAFMLGGTRDTDKDGIADDLEGTDANGVSCVDQPEDIDQFQDEDGCPDLDNDGDGIADIDDAECPNDAEDMDEFQDEDGCPDLDNDEDGIADVDDDCPMQTGHSTAKGCPDEDGDAIIDNVDECQKEAGPESSFGCPDKDGDRVPDYRDECPDDKAQDDINPLRSNGCDAMVYYADDKLVIMEKVQFASGRATIRSASFELLNNVAEALKRAPDVLKVEVQGHTDSSGDDDKNMKLSEDRAQAVVDYLVKKEIEAERLVAKGYGETVPVGDNETTEGKDANRRVEFLILEQKKNMMLKRKGKKADDGEGEGAKEDDGAKKGTREVPEGEATEAAPAEEKKATRPAAEEKAAEAAPAEKGATRPAVEEKAAEAAPAEKAATRPAVEEKAAETKEAVTDEAKKATRAAPAPVPEKKEE